MMSIPFIMEHSQSNNNDRPQIDMNMNHKTQCVLKAPRYSNYPTPCH